MVPFLRRKACRFCKDPDLVISYKAPDILVSYIGERGKIIPRRVTGLCSKHQRQIANAIKQARFMSLLSFNSLETLE